MENLSLVGTLMGKNPFAYLPKFVSKCYDLYYKSKFGPILDVETRYELQRFLKSKDPESILLGIAQLINYSAGNDLLRHCSFRMAWASDWEIKNEPEKVKWYKVGDIQLNNDTRIQEILDKLKEVYLSLPEDLSAEQKVSKCFSYLGPIAYWMLYHQRIGSNTSACRSIIKYPDPSWHDEPPQLDTWGPIYFWDWRTMHWRWEIKQEEYWKTHNKEEYLNKINK